MAYTISELARESGVTSRTIRYYVELGLLQPPEGAGRAAAYTGEHRDRLALIKLLQASRLSLDEIRDELAQRKPGAEPDLPTGGPASPSETAAEYLARLRYDRLSESTRPRYAPTPAPLMSAFATSTQPDEARAIPSERGESYVAEQWARIPLSPDVELHVRRRGNRTHPRLAKLISEARRILNEV